MYWSDLPHFIPKKQTKNTHKKGIIAISELKIVLYLQKTYSKFYYF